MAGPGLKQASAYRREAGQWLIEIRLPPGERLGDEARTLPDAIARMPVELR